MWPFLVAQETFYSLVSICFCNYVLEEDFFLNSDNSTLSWIDGNILPINVNKSFNYLMLLFSSYSNGIILSLSINPHSLFFNGIEHMYRGFGYLEVSQLFGIKWTSKSKNTWYGLLCQTLDVLRWLTFRSMFADYNSPVCL